MTRKRWIVSAAGAAMLIAATLVPAAPAVADVAEFDYYCGGTLNCRVYSTSGSGGVQHYRDGTLRAGWSNSGTVTRVSYHPAGYHYYNILSASTITAQWANCYCPSSPCAV